MKLLSLGNESIAFQSGAFFKDLALVIKDLRESTDNSRDKLSKAAVRIDKCVFDHTGISVNTYMLTQQNDEAFIALPALTRGNVLSRAAFNKFLEKNFDPKTLSFYNLEQKGWIDPGASRVGGAFSEIIFKQYYSVNWLMNKRFTPEELAGVILHEIGHAYTFLQFLADTIVVNSVLQRTWQELTSQNADKKVKLILTKAADDLRIKNRDWLEPIEDKDDGAVAFKVFATAVAIEPRAMDNKRYFSGTAAEELADIFAARHGAAMAIVSMRSKFISGYKSYDYLLPLGWTLFGLVMIPFLAPVGLMMGCLGAFATLYTAYEQGSDAWSAKDITSFKQEAKKMRNQMIEKIKTGPLPKDEVAELVAQIELTDELIQNYEGDLPPTLLVKFFDMFRRGKVDARASREYSDRLEDLAANDLFLHAAKLGTAAK